MSTKPHKGKIEYWWQYEIGDHGLGYIIRGEFSGHPEFHGQVGHTSYVVKRDGKEIETRNSRYTLGTISPVEIIRQQRARHTTPYLSEVFDDYTAAKEWQRRALYACMAADYGIRDAAIDSDANFDTKQTRWRVLVRVIHEEIHGAEPEELSTELPSLGLAQEAG